MAEPFLSEIRIMSFGFAPKGWALCNGQLLPINQNQALFSLLGTTYGGDGRVNFGLPDLRGRTPVSFGNGISQGQRGGEDSHTLIIDEVPAHTHQLSAIAATANQGKPNGHLLATTASALTIYTTPSNLAPVHPASIGNTGGSQPHANQQPFLVMNWVIALTGIFPSQS